MDKETLLQELKLKVNSGEISREEVTTLFASEVPKMAWRWSASKMLYAVGAAIVVIGLVIFFAQIWEDIGAVGRIAVTLGLGLIMAIIGSVLFRQRPGEHLGAVFHFIGGALIPSGALVTLSELKVEFIHLWPITITFGVIFLFYLALTAIHRHPVLTFFAIGNGTAFIYLLVESIVTGPAFQHEDIYAYLTMVMGACYLLLAQSFRGGWNHKLVGVLHFFGAGGFLGAAFSQVFDSEVWQIFYFLVVFAGLWLSVNFRSRVILILSTLFLLAHVSYITSEYFADSIGWPISLVILGFIFIGLGYASLSISKKYIRG